MAEGKKRLDSLPAEEKIKYLLTAQRMSDKARSEMMVNIKLGEEYLFFYGQKSPFSQWHKCSFIVQNEEFTCTEQYMMYMKARLFEDNKTASIILASGYAPKEHKNHGRMIKNFNQAIWDKNKISIVKTGNFYKFSQNKNLLNILLETKPKILVEASASDLVWGIGLSLDDPNRFDQRQWKGENLLGYILTSLREELLANNKPAVPIL